MRRSNQASIVSPGRCNRQYKGRAGLKGTAYDRHCPGLYIARRGEPGKIQIHLYVRIYICIYTRSRTARGCKPRRLPSVPIQLTAEVTGADGHRWHPFISSVKCLSIKYMTSLSEMLLYRYCSINSGPVPSGKRLRPPLTSSTAYSVRNQMKSTGQNGLHAMPNEAMPSQRLFLSSKTASADKSAVKQSYK